MNSDRSDTTRSSSYEFLEDLVDYGEALEELEASSKDGTPHIPTFVQRMLERLKEVGLLHRIDIESPRNMRKVKLDKGQDVWIRFDRYRDRREGYMAVEVVDAPRSDRAILAAMVAWLGQPVDFEQLLEVVRFFASPESKDQI